MMNLKEVFKPICIDDKPEDNVYEIGLIATHKDLTSFGRKLDGNDYRDDCWRCILSKGESEWYDIISYVANDGSIFEYCKADKEFKNYVFKKLNVE